MKVVVVEERGRSKKFYIEVYDLIEALKKKP